MAEKSRRGFAAGVVGAGCTLRLAPALYGVTGIGQSKWGRQLLLRLSTQAPSRGCPLRGTHTTNVSDPGWNYFWGASQRMPSGFLPVTTPPTTAYTLEPVTGLLPRGPPPDNAPTHRRAPDGAAARKPGAAPSRPGQRLDSHHATMEYINGAAPSFKGLPLPEGLERHNLYASAFRV